MVARRATVRGGVPCSSRWRSRRAARARVALLSGSVRSPHAWGRVMPAASLQRVHELERHLKAAHRWTNHCIRRCNRVVRAKAVDRWRGEMARALEVESAIRGALRDSWVRDDGAAARLDLPAGKWYRERFGIETEQQQGAG